MNNKLTLAAAALATSTIATKIQAEAQFFDAIGDWFENDFVDFWVEDVGGAFEDIGEWFETDFVDFWTDDFVDFWTDDFVGFFEDLGDWFAGDFANWWKEDFVDFSNMTQDQIAMHHFQQFDQNKDGHKHSDSTATEQGAVIHVPKLACTLAD